MIVVVGIVAPQRVTMVTYDHETQMAENYYYTN